MNEVRKSEFAGAKPQFRRAVRSASRMQPVIFAARPVRREDDQRMEHRGQPFPKSLSGIMRSSDIAS